MKVNYPSRVSVGFCVFITASPLLSNPKNSEALLQTRVTGGGTVFFLECRVVTQVGPRPGQRAGPGCGESGCGKDSVG